MEFWIMLGKMKESSKAQAFRTCIIAVCAVFAVLLLAAYDNTDTAKYRCGLYWASRKVTARARAEAYADLYIAYNDPEQAVQFDYNRAFDCAQKAFENYLQAGQETGSYIGARNRWDVMKFDLGGTRYDEISDQYTRISGRVIFSEVGGEDNNGQTIYLSRSADAPPYTYIQYSLDGGLVYDMLYDSPETQGAAIKFYDGTIRITARLAGYFGGSSDWQTVTCSCP